MVAKRKNPVVRVLWQGRKDLFIPRSHADALYRQGKLDIDPKTLTYKVR